MAVYVKQTNSIPNIGANRQLFQIDKLFATFFVLWSANWLNLALRDAAADYGDVAKKTGLLNA